MFSAKYGIILICNSVSILDFCTASDMISPCFESILHTISFIEIILPAVSMPY